MVGCSAAGCKNSYVRSCNIKCHFPKDLALRRVWLTNMKRGRWKPGNQAYLCELHFESEMWEERNGVNVLKSDAVPTLFTFAKRTLRRRRKKPIKDVSTTEESSFSEDSTTSSTATSSKTDESKDIVEVKDVTPKNTNPPVSNQAMQQPQKVFNPCSQYKANSYTNNYPICQDVRFCKLPFFHLIAELLKPSSLIPNTTNQRMQEKVFYFYLTPQQTDDIIQSRTIKPGYICEFEKQVHLRFCLSETVCEQEDFFPPNVSVRVNNRICPLPVPVPSNKPNVESKRPSVPVNITPFIKLSSTLANSVAIMWSVDYGPGYTVSISLVKKLSTPDLIDHLKKKGEMHSDHTRSLIKEKLTEDADSEIMTTCLRVSLLCPLGKMRMGLPCRASTCKHLQCFDASIYVAMNERKPTWNCPVCDKPALFDNLVIDGYFNEIMASSELSSDLNEIELNKDGSWSMHSKENVKVFSRAASQNNDTIEIIGDDNEFPTQESSAKSNQKSIEIVDLVISDSEDEAEEVAVPAPAPASAPNPPQIDTIISLDSTSSSSSSSSSSGSDSSDDSDDLPLAIRLNNQALTEAGVPKNRLNQKEIEITPIYEEPQTRREPTYYPPNSDTSSQSDFDGQPSKFCKLNEEVTISSSTVINNHEKIKEKEEMQSPAIDSSEPSTTNNLSNFNSITDPPDDLENEATSVNV